jgi:FAD/FMN-containing dehydrogenase
MLSNDMLVSGSTISDISEALAQLSSRGSKVDGLDLSALNQVLEYHPEDMTVTVQTGITLASLQRKLSEHGQWLPIDPHKPEKTTVDEIINRNLSGPRRYGYGTIREHLIGLKAVLADGRIIQNGGKVVKNVAGFDLCKLFVGSQWSLGIVVEATFRLWPLPNEELFLVRKFETSSATVLVVQQINESEITPVVLDLHSTKLPECSVVIGLAGTRAEVKWQREKAASFGFSTPTTLEYEARFWESGDSCNWTSVLPSKIGREIESRSPLEFVARAGNGTLFYRGGLAPERPQIPLALNKRLKETFDPKNILPMLS